VRVNLQSKVVADRFFGRHHLAFFFFVISVKKIVRIGTAGGGTVGKFF